MPTEARPPREPDSDATAPADPGDRPEIPRQDESFLAPDDADAPGDPASGGPSSGSMLGPPD
jgi:hypothetical protein